MPPFHIGTLNSSRWAPAKRSNTRRAAAQASASGPRGVPPEKTVILARAPTEKSGREPSHRSQCSTVASAWLSANEQAGHDVFLLLDLRAHAHSIFGAVRTQERAHARN